MTKHVEDQKAQVILLAENKDVMVAKQDQVTDRCRWMRSV